MHQPMYFPAHTTPCRVTATFPSSFTSFSCSLCLSLPLSLSHTIPAVPVISRLFCTIFNPSACAHLFVSWVIGMHLYPTFLLENAQLLIILTIAMIFMKYSTCLTVYSLPFDFNAQLIGNSSTSAVFLQLLSIALGILDNSIRCVAFEFPRQ